MKNTSLAKTLTASLPLNARDTFVRISDPDNLPSWHPSFCRSVRRESGSILVESPRGTVPVHFIRDDHSLVLDIVVLVSEGIKLTHAIRLLPNGEGCEIVWTLIKPEGLADSVYHEQLRWAGNALHQLRKPPVATTVQSEEAAGVQEPTPAQTDAASAPVSGKKLFIGNLSYDWTDDQLRAHFAETGTITLAEVARFRGRGGRSRGFGFVEMSSEAEAQTAIEKLHGGLAGGRQIIVRLAKSQESRPAPKAPESTEAGAKNSVSAQDAPEPGNELNPPAKPAARPHRPTRPRRSLPTSRTPTASRQSDSLRRPRAQRPYQEQDISNKSGYEIFPRRTPR